MIVGFIQGIVAALTPLTNALSSLASFATNVINMIVALFRGDFTGAIDFAKNAVDDLKNFFINGFDAILSFIGGFARYHTVLVIVNYNYLMLDGSWNLDGAQILSGVIRNFKVSVESNIQMLGVDEKLTNLKHIIEHNYWTLNGQVLLDGNRNLDAYRYEEEIL